MWLKNVWYVAGFPTEVEDALLARRLLNQNLVFFRDGTGEIAAVEDRCPHRLVPLSLGKRTPAGTIECGYHGMQFDGQGLCTFAPGRSSPRGVKAKSFPVVTRHNLIWIWMGDPDLADAALIPDIRWFDDPNWTVAPGYHHFNADYRLLTDNLLDLSHETYVHQRTIGQGAIAESEPSVEVAEDGAVRAYREMRNIDPPPFFQLFMDYREGKIHRTQLAFYAPPGINMTQYSGQRVEGDQTIYLNRVMHLLTPETEHSTHYFWGQARNYRLDDVDLSAAITQGTILTFDEDREMLERQQAVLIAEQASVPQAATNFDIAPVRAQRFLAKLIEREQADPTFVSQTAHIAD